MSKKLIISALILLVSILLIASSVFANDATNMLKMLQMVQETL